MVTLVAVAASAAAAFTVRGSAVGPPGSEVVDVVRDAAQGRPVLASEPLAETLAQAGVTVWAANPIDAFPREVQGQFLDFLHDGTVPDDPAIGLVVVAEEAAPAVEAGRGVGGEPSGRRLRAAHPGTVSRSGQPRRHSR